MERTPANFLAIGKLLFGDSWESGYVVNLNNSPRLIQRWASGAVVIPDQVWHDIAELLKTRGDALRSMGNKIMEHVTVPFSRFYAGQEFVGKRPPHRVARVIDIADDGRMGWVEVSDPQGRSMDSAWVAYAQFMENWIPRQSALTEILTRYGIPFIPETIDGHLHQSEPNRVWFRANGCPLIGLDLRAATNLLMELEQVGDVLIAPKLTNAIEIAKIL